VVVMFGSNWGWPRLKFAAPSPAIDPAHIRH
jgi:hypothetical protein